MALKSDRQEKIALALRRTQNLFDRAKTATNLRDQISRAYYACYHAAISAILLKQDYDRRDFSGSAHQEIPVLYASLYSKTKKNRIMMRGNIINYWYKWKNLRASADYDIFTEDFESVNEDMTNQQLDFMYVFVQSHLSFVQKESQIDVIKKKGSEK